MKWKPKKDLLNLRQQFSKKGNNLGIAVPETVIEQLSAGKRPPVVITIKNKLKKTL